MPSTPTIAPGTSPATAPNATIIAESKPIPAMPFTSTSTSIPLRASMTPEKKAIRTFTADWISVGRFFATPSRIAIRNWNPR